VGNLPQILNAGHRLHGHPPALETPLIAQR
jgi:hypothetical protein